MSDCCAPATPCCGTVDTYEYGAAPYVTGEIGTFAGPVPRVATELTSADRRGTLRVRSGIRRGDYRVRPGLYGVGEPDDASPVLVTANYKLSFDAVREQLRGRDAWLLVLNTRGINVWCAAGKGTFSTAEVVGRIRDARLEQVVSHTRLVLPQLGATGVAAHEVRAQTGFSVVWGPVRADDLPAFLDAGMKATTAMRRVTFPIKERAKLIGVEVGVLWRPRTLVVLSALAVATVLVAWLLPQWLPIMALTVTTALLALIAGAAVTPLLLPWLPGRAFSLKGAVAGSLVITPAYYVAFYPGDVPVWASGVYFAGVALASYVAMNFTGSSTYTSPSGVEWEMRRAIPWQLGGAVAGVFALLAGLVVG